MTGPARSTDDACVPVDAAREIEYCYARGWTDGLPVVPATLRLVLLNCLCYFPGVSDRATMGTPGKYTCCIAENEENHPWEPWHVERGFKAEQSTVTLVAASSMLQVWNYGTHEQLLRAAADA